MSDADRIELGRFAGRFEMKAAAAAGQDEGFFTGHGALFSVPHPTSSWMLDDDWMDVFAPGSFTRTIANHKAAKTRPAMLLQHERGQIIGSWRAFSEDKAGLYLEGQLTMGKQLGRDVHADMKNQALDALSVGFRAVKAELDEAKKTRTLLDVDLGEVSVVDIGGCPGAVVSDVKAMNDRQHTQTAAQLGALQSCCTDCDNCDGRDEMMAGLKACLDTMGEGKSAVARPEVTKRFLERVLRDVGLKPEEAKAFIAKGFSALDAPRDVGVGGLLAAVQELTHKIRKAV